MSDNQRIDEALAALGLTITAAFVPFSLSRNKGSKHRTLNWDVTVLRKGHVVLTTPYAAGIAHAPAYQRRRGNTAIETETETGYRVGPLGKPTHERILPDTRDVFYTLILEAGSIMNSRGFETWCDEYGLDTDSRAAYAAWQQCVDNTLKLRYFIGDDGLQTLSEVFDGL